MGLEIINCPAYADGICWENKLLMRKCKNYDLCLSKQILNRTNEQAVKSLFETEEADD